MAMTEEHINILKGTPDANEPKLPSVRVAQRPPLNKKSERAKGRSTDDGALCFAAVEQADICTSGHDQTNVCQPTTPSAGMRLSAWCRRVPVELLGSFAQRGLPRRHEERFPSPRSCTGSGRTGEDRLALPACSEEPSGFWLKVTGGNSFE
ncbi:hypothetical protein EYF80_039533 [Liparis tanakae]|uniref:Uncharacterized protein n=1 Tax=Liparis tanakae TaxID=230148 RepID=A0A4Z2G9R2_9TELE|nr:hypothetical protein EYF80_039533 [Liparis tanakae]